MSWRSAGVAVIACGALAACTSVHSRMTLDGSLFGPDECKNGQDEEFFGVDLRDARGTTLRLVANPDDTTTIVVFAPGEASYAATGCAQMSLDRTDNDKYGHYIVSGDATVDCVAGPYVVRGSTQFDLCAHVY